MPFWGSPTALVCHGDTFGGVLQMRGSSHTGMAENAQLTLKLHGQQWKPGTATAGPRCSWTFEYHSCEHVTKAFAVKAFESPSRLMTKHMLMLETDNHTNEIIARGLLGTQRGGISWTAHVVLYVMFVCPLSRTGQL